MVILRTCRMWKLSIIACLVIFANNAGQVESVGNDDNGDLISVVVIFRHGDRTPIDPYPNDPYKNLSFWPVDYGQLTNLGKQQHFLLGKWLRARYNTFLPEDYSERDILVRSTDVDRTLMSADANLAGLYMPSGKQIWEPTIHWQPIPIHTTPEAKDYLVAMKKPCDKLEYLHSQVLNSSRFKEIMRENHDLFVYLTMNAGKPIYSIQQLEYLYSNLFIESVNNFTLPDWTKSVFPDKILPLARLSFAIPTYTTEMARLKTGPFFNELLDDFYNSSSTAGKHSSYRKMWMYSGHDTTIANVLNSLQLFDLHTPPYTSTILIELRSLNNSFFVNLFYKNTSVARQLKLPNCALNCPLDEFAMILEPIAITPEKWHQECQLNTLEFLQFTTLQNVIVVVCSIMFIMLIISLIIGMVCSKPKCEKRNYLRLPDSDETV